MDKFTLINTLAFLLASLVAFPFLIWDLKWRHSRRLDISMRSHMLMRLQDPSQLSCLIWLERSVSMFLSQVELASWYQNSTLNSSEWCWSTLTMWLTRRGRLIPKRFDRLMITYTSHGVFFWKVMNKRVGAAHSSGQSYKHFTLVNYKSWVIIWGIFQSGTTLGS